MENQELINSIIRLQAVSQAIMPGVGAIPQGVVGKNIGLDITKPRQIAIHVGFLDVVGYSLGSDSKQLEIVMSLTRVIRQTINAFNLVKGKDIIVIPTGDGFAFSVIENVPLLLVQFAKALLTEVKKDNDFKIRIGLHSTYGFLYEDVNGNPNISGNGVNWAARIEQAAGKKKMENIIWISYALKQLIEGEKHPYKIQTVGKQTFKHGKKEELFSIEG